MKKILLTLTTLALTSLSADFLRVEGGAGAWVQEPTGTVAEKNIANAKLDLVETLGYENNTNYYAWVYFKHFIPLVPNARLEVANSEFAGNAKTGFNWDGNNYPVDTHTNLAINQYDAILYYNILDNLFWMTLDVGLDFKYMKIDSAVQGQNLASSDFGIALLYARGRVEIPATGLAVEADAKGFSYGSAQIYDVRAKIDYKFDFPVIQPGVEVGYRYERIYADSSSVVPIDAKTDITISGAYLGFNLSF